jgi:hypothetical protein
MSSPLPATEKLIYYIQTKMQCEIPHDLRHDIETTLWNYAQEVSLVERHEKNYWRDMFFGGKGK